MRRKVVFAFVLLLCVLGARVGTVHAQHFDFWCITDNNPTNAAIGEAQLSLEVTDGVLNPGHVVFIFTNEGPDNCSITDVYFDDGTLTTLTTLIDIDEPEDIDHPWYGMGHAGVDFTQDADPADLPGGDDPDLIDPLFEVSLGFSADSDPPPPFWGVEAQPEEGSDEWLGIEFTMNGGTLEQVIQELNSGILRVGIHVQNFDISGSESFVNVPEPATIALLGLGGLALLRRRRK